MDPIPPVRPYGRPNPQNQGNENIRFSTSIDLKMTAKGYYYWDITVYGEENITEKLREIDDKLKLEFPKNVTTIPEQ